MLEEIYGQPRAIRETIERNISGDLIFPGALAPLENSLFAFTKIILAASGSSRNAGLAGEIMVEDLAGVAVDVEYASEYSYRSAHAGTDPLVLVITQSGETADTIAAQREALKRGATTIAISNVVQSTIAREATVPLYSYAGVEKAVPATKSFTAQLTMLYLLALLLARTRGRMTIEVARARLKGLAEVPNQLERSLSSWDNSALAFAKKHCDGKGFLFLGRGVHYAIAREGALKMKEISLVQAEGLPTGELRHGPNALVDNTLTVVALATCDAADPDSVLRYERTLSVLEYVRERGGNVLAIVSEGDRRVEALAEHIVPVPAVTELVSPILEVVPLQLLAYHMGVLTGSNVDQPRNLVKAVITE
jgi:glucosamine--fructose-6-phosphate aminotransferase (isomerizing)